MSRWHKIFIGCITVSYDTAAHEAKDTRRKTSDSTEAEQVCVICNIHVCDNLTILRIVFHSHAKGNGKCYSYEDIVPEYISVAGKQKLAAQYSTISLFWVFATRVVPLQLLERQVHAVARLCLAT